MTDHALTTPTPHIQSFAEADTTQLLGGSITIRMRGADSAGRMGMTEQVVPGGYPGPALHVHPEFEETFYVMSGTIALRVGEAARDAGPGTVAHVPRGVAHTFANPSEEPARMLVIVTPAGFEAYFEALAAAIVERGGVPAAEEIVALGVEHGSVPAWSPGRGTPR